MSFEVLLSQNKILAYFTLDSSANVQEISILQPSIYTTFIYHNHYPVIYYKELFQHFSHCLPKGTEVGNLRIYFNKKQLPAELPIGLYITKSPACFTVGVDLSVSIPDAFRILKNSWKKTFEVINANRRCDYVKTRLSENQLRHKFRLYCEGFSHGLQKQGLYQGTHMIVKGMVDDDFIQRKYSVAQYKTMREIVQQIFGFSEQQLKNGGFRVLSHTIDVDLNMSSKMFLDEWSYNDGYCYIKLSLKGESQGEEVQ